MTNETTHKRTLLIGVATAALLLAIVAMIASVTSATTANTLTIDYQAYGNVRLLWATNGEHDDDLTAPSAAELDALPDMGEIDLGLMLEEIAAGSVRGYVDLDNSLVYSTEHSVETTLLGETVTQMTGPAVNGTYSDGTLSVQSERRAYTTQSGQLIERQFWLEGTGTPEMMTGEYRETIWGYGLKPLTIVGDFQLRIIASEQPEAPSVPLAVELSPEQTVLSFDSGVVVMVVIALATAIVTTAALVRQRQNRP